MNSGEKRKKEETHILVLERAVKCGNLNYEVEGSSCYNNDSTNCIKHGRLYTWEAAQQACAALGEG